MLVFIGKGTTPGAVPVVCTTSQDLQVYMRTDTRDCSIPPLIHMSEWLLFCAHSLGVFSLNRCESMMKICRLTTEPSVSFVYRCSPC